MSLCVRVAVPSICLFCCSLTFGDESSAIPPATAPRTLPKTVDKAVESPSLLDHLRQAAEHLEAASQLPPMDEGADRWRQHLAEMARSVRETADEQERQATERLDELTQQLTEIQKEIQRLRQLTGRYEQIRLDCQIAEVAADALRESGLDWGVSSTVKKAVTHIRVNAGPVRSQLLVSDEMDVLLKKMVRSGAAKILAQPSLVTTPGRRASLHSGGEFPILVPQNQETATIEWREFGVRMEALPVLLGNSRLRLELAPELSERDFSSSVNVKGTLVPGITTRRINTQVEMKFGQSLIFGLVSRAENELPEVSKVANQQAGERLFKNTRETEEKFLVFVVTPRCLPAEK